MQLTDVWAHHHTSAPHTPKRRREVRPSKGRAEADLVQELQLSPSPLDHSVLCGLWEEGVLCDVVCKARDGTESKAHKVVLAAASPFFRALFAGTGAVMQEGTSSSKMQVVELPGLSGNVMASIFRAMYTGNLKVTPENIQGVLAGSSLLQAAAVLQGCAEYLQSHMTLDNCLDVLQLAVAYNLEELQEEALHFACTNFTEVLKDDDGSSWKQLPEECVRAVLGSSDMVIADSELDVFRAVVDWVAADEERRHPLLAQLLQSHVLLAMLSPSCLQTQVALHPGVARSPEATAVVTAAIDASIHNRSRRNDGIMVLGGHDSGWQSLRTSEIYDLQSNRWDAGPVLPSIMTPALSFVGCAVINSDLYAIGGSSFYSPVAVYNHRQGVWSSCAPLQMPRVNMAVASCCGSLFAIGGRTGTGMGHFLNTVEFLDPRDGQTWQKMPISMTAARASLGAASLGGGIYVVGGQAQRNIVETVEVLDVSTGIWTTLQAPVLQPRKYLGVCAVEGRLFAIGGMNAQRERLATVEAYDPREGVWKEVGPMNVARSSAGVAALHGNLYAVGGNGIGDRVHDSVEVYEPAMESWRYVAPIPTPRSGLGVAAV